MKKLKPKSRRIEAPDILYVQLLGGFSVTMGLQTIEEDAWRLRKAKNLLKLLALAPGHRLHREQVYELLWPHLTREEAAVNLRRTLYVARHALEPMPANYYIQFHDNQLVLCPDLPLAVDVEAFRAAAATVRRSRDPASYRAALELYSGDLLPEDLYEEWTTAPREELQTLYWSLLFELAKLYEARHENDLAIQALQHVIAGDPAHEEAHIDLMRLYAHSGQRHQALRQYAQLRTCLREQLQTEPDITSQKLYQEILAGFLPNPKPTRPRGRHNLPTYVSSFIGRERELAEVKRLLTTTRLLTLTGTGGCGKTRLALRTATDLVAEYAAGVWLVRLEALSDPLLVPQAVAQALGVQEEPNRPLLATLVDFLRTKPLLLVLDNCEQVIAAAARLAETLLSQCPQLKILATSREKLHVAGEQSWQLPCLSLPEAGQMSPAALSQSEAVQLFLERANSQEPDFALTPANAPAIVEICRRLEGIPLALELAAARIAVLSVEQIAARLDDSLKLLMGGSRISQPRQQTLRATLDWSYNLLSQPEQALFNRLSIFADSFALEAAEAVAAGQEVHAEDVLELLSQLIDKSLVMVKCSLGGVLCYRMLEPARQYGRQHLVASGKAEIVKHRHATFRAAVS